MLLVFRNVYLLLDVMYVTEDVKGNVIAALS